MSLNSGAKLGPYEILSPLGAGGMGEVYRARDSRLKRDVAIKVLPQALSFDADRLHRDGGAPQPIRGMLADERFLGFGNDHTIFVANLGQLPQKVYELNALTGERKLWKEISPADRAGADSLGGLHIELNGKAYIYWYFRSLSQLYVFQGLH